MRRATGDRAAFFFFMGGPPADQGEAPPLSSESSRSSIRRVFPLSRCLFTDLQPQSIFCKVSFPSEISCRRDEIACVYSCGLILFYLFIIVLCTFFICLSVSLLPRMLAPWGRGRRGLSSLLVFPVGATQSRTWQWRNIYYL